MRRKNVPGLLAAVALTLTLSSAPVASAPSTAIAWQGFDAGVFERARAERKFVLLDLEAVWCHWCHVMDATTYVHPRVVQRLGRDFIAVKVDHDARPDLANRYRNYGWPATVLFDPEGRELAKKAGYISPEDMIALLDNAPNLRPLTQSTDVVPGVLDDALRATLDARHRKTADRERGGLTTAQKFLDGDAVEYSLLLGQRGDADEALQARRTLDAAIALIDPVWGGAFQYSTGGVWSRPHFEKIMRTQARFLRVYARAYRATGDEKYLKVVHDVRRFIDAFLTSPEGAFYVSQDADAVPGEHAAEYFALGDVQRRAKGVPRVDENVYAQENGWAIEALAEVSIATGDASALDAALRAAAWVMTHHRRPDGAFRHAEGDETGPYLGDNLAMAQAFLALYRATRKPDWLAEAQKLARYIDGAFRAPTGWASGVDNGTPVPPVPQIDENIAVARFAAALHGLLGDRVSRGIYDHAIAYLASPAIATRRLSEPGILLADLELREKAKA